MAGKRKSRRNFGRVRKLPSGRFQARYPGPDGCPASGKSHLRDVDGR